MTHTDDLKHPRAMTDSHLPLPTYQKNQQQAYCDKARRKKFIIIRRREDKGQSDMADNILSNYPFKYKEADDSHARFSRILDTPRMILLHGLLLLHLSLIQLGRLLLLGQSKHFAGLTQQ